VPPSPERRRSATSYGLMGPGLLSTLYFLASMLRSHNGKKAKGHFLPRQWSCFSVLLFSPGPRSNDKVIVWGKSGQPLKGYFTQPLAYSWGDLLFCHSFLIVPKTPVSLLGQDLLSQLKARILLPPTGNHLCCPLLQEQIDPTVWTDGMTVG
jgi:hypothetical protein